LENTICKARKGGGENTESKKIQEGSLSGDQREEGKLVHQKEMKGTHELEGIKGGTIQDREREKASDTHFLQSTEGETCQNVENKKERN
jgi:hypothetical protein